MTISFNKIPPKIGVPGAYFEFDGRLARSGLQYRTVRYVVFGLMNEATGTANQNIPYQVTSQKTANTLFGDGSMLSSMYECLYTTNPYNEIWLLAVPEVGTKAAFTATYTGTATEASVATLLVGGRRYVVEVAIGDSAADVAGAIADEINEDTDATFTAAASGSVVTITVNFKGELGNDLQIDSKYEEEVMPAGLSVAVAHSVVATGSPDVSDAIAVIEPLDFTDCVFPFTDSFNMGLIEQELDNRWAPLPSANSTGSGEKDMHLWQALRGTETELAAWHANRNNQHVTTMALEKGVTVSGVSYQGFATPSWVMAAAYAGVGGYYSGIDPNGNLQNIEITCVKGAPKWSRWHWNERNRLILNYGFATYKYSMDGMGDDVILERATTNCRFTINGAQTDAEMDTETQKLNSYLRWDLRNYLQSVYPRHKLADDGPRVSRSQNVTTPNRIRAQVWARAGLWSDAGLIENLEDFKSWLTVERSTADCNTANILVRPDHVNQLRVMAGQFLYKVC